VTSCNFENPRAHGYQRPTGASGVFALFVDISLRFTARDYRVEFLKIAASRNFETSQHAVKKQ